MRPAAIVEQSLFTVLHAGLSWIRLSYTYTTILKTKQANLLTMIYCLLCKRTNGGTNGSGSGRGFEVHHDQCQAQRQSMPFMYTHHYGAQGRQAWLVLSKLSVCKYIGIITNHATTAEIQICLKYLGKRPNSRCKAGIAEAKYTYSSVDFRWPFKHVRKAAKRESD